MHELQNALLYTGQQGRQSKPRWDTRSAYFDTKCILSTTTATWGMTVIPQNLILIARNLGIHDRYKNGTNSIMSDTDRSKRDAAYYREWRRANPNYYKAKVECKTCGCLIRRSGMSEHRLSRKHIIRLAQAVDRLCPDSDPQRPHVDRGSQPPLNPRGTT